MEGMIGEIRLFAGNFSPKSWSYCAGQVMQVQQNTALFSILGSVYGGNGSTTFSLPDLRGRVAIGTGTGNGLTARVLGQVGGTVTNSITMAQMAAHTHLIGSGGTATISGTLSATMAVNNNAGSGTAGLPPNGNYLGEEQATSYIYSSAPSSTGGVTDTLNPAAITMTGTDMKASLAGISLGAVGAGYPYSNLQPYLGMSYIICMFGIYPSRN